MWILWSFITFIVYEFSTKKLICVICTLTVYRKYLEGLKHSKQAYRISFVINMIVTSTWLIIAFTVPLIRESWVYVLSAELICLFCTFFIFRSKILYLLREQLLKQPILEMEYIRKNLELYGINVPSFEEYLASINHNKDEVEEDEYEEDEYDEDEVEEDEYEEDEYDEDEVEEDEYEDFDDEEYEYDEDIQDDIDGIEEQIKKGLKE